MAEPRVILVLLLPLLAAGVHITQQVSQAEPQTEHRSSDHGVVDIASPAGTARAMPNPNQLCGKCRCGRPKRPPSSESGVEVGPAEMPWLVLVHIGDFNVTTGTLINDRYVVCAAAPLYGYRARDVKVSLGAENMCVGDISTLNMSVAEINLHPQYDLDFMASDLSLLRLSSPVIFTPTISPVCLPPSDVASYVGQVSMAASWGAEPPGASGVTNFNVNGKACRAHKQPLPVLQQRDCFLSNVSARLITQDKGCAGIVGAASLACSRDAGGPLLFRTPHGAYQLIGVLATANNCEFASGPSLYTHVAPYLRWLVDNTRDACVCSL